MNRRIKNAVLTRFRRLACLPLRLLGHRQCAAAVEELSGGLIADAEANGTPIRFLASSPLLLDRALNVTTKEPDMIRWIDSFEPDTVLWDIGANVGVFTLYAAMRRKAQVLAFEPSAANYYVLTRNICLNNLTERATAYCVALSGATELGVLNIGSSELGGAMSQFGRSGENSRYWTGGDSDTHGMLGMTMDDFIERFKPPFPTQLKMDVDGLEWPILQGAVKTLRDPRLRAAMIELSLNDHEERERAMKLLGDSGFRFVSHGTPQGTETEGAANHLFERICS